MSDQLTDNLLTTDAAGRIGANFTGRVHAQGLDLDLAAPLGSQIRWLSASQEALAFLYTTAPAGLYNALIAEIEEAGGANDRVRTIIDSRGFSSFAQLATAVAVTFGFAKAHSTAAFTYTAADTNRRVYAPARTLDFDSMAAVHATNTYLVAPGAGKYLVGLIVDQLTLAGNVMVAAIKNDVTVLRALTCNCALGTDAGFKAGAAMWDVFDLANGDTVKYIGWHSGGGNAVLTLVAVRIPL